MAVGVRGLPGPAKELLRLLVVGLIYYVAARLSLQLALVRGQVTPVWPPTGIAVVAMLLVGTRVWPAIALAAFAVNLPIGPTPLAAAAIAVGNTLAPMTSTLLMKRAGFHLELDRLRDAATLILLGALAGMAISATIGSTVLVLSGAVPPNDFPQTWAVWWTGDAMGVLLVAPFLLSLRPRPGDARLTAAQGTELALILAGVAVVTFVVFQARVRVEYLVFPLIMAAALRYRLRGAAPAALIASGVAVWAAVHGTGLFATEDLFQKMITLQVFNVFVAMASFVLATYVDTREREEQVTRLYASAKRANQTRSDFMNQAAHELRSPLTVVNGYFTMLSDGSFGSPPEAWRGPLDIVDTKIAELNRIIDELLDAARIDSEALTRSRREVDLRRIVADAVERARARAELVGAEITIEPASEELSIVADFMQVGRILVNLLNNSMNYSEQRPKISVHESIENGQAVVRVTDNGLGIPLQFQERVFEPFYRREEPGFQEVLGTGLGLYVSRQLAESHQGKLVIERSEPGAGSTFMLSIPLAPAHAPQPAEPASDHDARPERQSRATEG
jgi:signal transduction histidine kinase